MEKRKLENLGIETSLLGFGCMRFPTKDGHIEEVEAEQMLDLAYKSGVNYIDTAWPYHGGESETFVGKVMKKYPRESFYLATKLPLWEVHSLDDAKRIFNKQLEKLQTDYIDFYLCHAFNGQRFDEVVSLGILDWLDELKAEGKIRYIGFSFHDSYEVFERIITYRKWDFCQIQYNYMDTNDQAGDKGYALAEKLNVPLVIMESIRGGELASFAPDVEQMFKAVRPEKSIASWALRWLGTKPQIKVILSGMSSLPQVEDNLNTFENFEVLNEKELATVDEVVKEIRSRRKVGCTGCRYCMPCPAGVVIPHIFGLWNKLGMYGNQERSTRSYKQVKPEETADNCMKCGACEGVCPQHLSIRDLLEQAHTELLG
ncbi:MAG: aldo/keto reductase [Lachnospiraceae bacterium]|nr:aldo/keto reductase [Lachnospiraceae bacterium]